MAEEKKIYLTLYDDIAAYYYDSNNPHKIVYDLETDTPIGLYNKNSTTSIYDFGIEAVCINGLDFNDINKDNCNNYLCIIIDICDACLKSRARNFPNIYGLCNCWCSGCGDLYRECECYRL